MLSFSALIVVVLLAMFGGVYAIFAERAEEQNNKLIADIRVKAQAIVRPFAWRVQVLSAAPWGFWPCTITASDCSVLVRGDFGKRILICARLAGAIHEVTGVPVENIHFKSDHVEVD